VIRGPHHARWSLPVLSKAERAGLGYFRKLDRELRELAKAPWTHWSAMGVSPVQKLYSGGPASML